MSKLSPPRQGAALCNVTESGRVTGGACREPRPSCWVEGTVPARDGSGSLENDLESS